MNNQEFKGLVSALEKVAGEQKTVTSLLLERLEVITKGVINIIESHDLEDDLEKFDFKDYGFRWEGSSHGKYIHLCYIDFSDGYYEDETILPTKTSEIGSNFYYHNDYNYPTKHMDREAVLNFCEILPEFIKNCISKIQSLTDKEKEFLNKYSE